jgi:hypothetical protein
MHHICAAGRTSFFGGRWREPCPQNARHSIGSPRAEPIWLCDEHFTEVDDAGLVAEPNLTEAEFQRREQARRQADAGSR